MWELHVQLFCLVDTRGRVPPLLHSNETPFYISKEATNKSKAGKMLLIFVIFKLHRLFYLCKIQYSFYAKENKGIQSTKRQHRRSGTL
jgi:hypothetical protein